MYVATSWGKKMNFNSCANMAGFCMDSHIWQISEEATSSDLVVRSQHTMKALKSKILIYHTQAMRFQLVSKYGRISPCFKLSLLRIMYKQLTTDHSSSTNEHEAKTDERMQQLIEIEDPEIVVDLHKHNEEEKVNMMSFGMSVKSIFKKLLEL